MAEWDYLIVGQGLAGTLLHYELQKTGARCLVIDRGLEAAASYTAAGIINPVTGRRFVKSWMIDTLLPEARETYAELEQLLQIHIVYDVPIIRSLQDARDREEWLIRTGDPHYQPYMSEDSDPLAYGSFTQKAWSYGRTLQSMRTDLRALTTAYRNQLRKRGELLEEAFRYDALKPESDRVTYGNLTARTMVFCEGHQSIYNPYFNYLPFRGTKGEILIIRVPGIHPRAILKNKIFLVPQGEDLFWIGATYERQFVTTSTTEAGKQYLVDQLDQLLTVPYEVVDHRAAVRPTVKHRRPLLGRHPDVPVLAIFNGLGTKGASLGPWSARCLSEHLTRQVPLLPDVDIARYAEDRSNHNIE